MYAVGAIGCCWMWRVVSVIIAVDAIAVIVAVCGVRCWLLEFVCVPLPRFERSFAVCKRSCTPFRHNF